MPIALNPTTSPTAVGEPKATVGNHCRGVCTEVVSENGKKIKIFAKKALDIASKVAVEAFKVQAVMAGLTIFVLLTTPAPLLPLAMYIVVIGPAIEELIFRGVIQNCIRLFQNSYNAHIRKTPPTEQDLQHQQNIRVGITSALFGVAHALNPGPLAGKIIQVTYCTIAGTSLGYTMEKTQTLALPILDHGINNGLVMAAMCNPAIAGPILMVNTGVFAYNTIQTLSGKHTVAGHIGKWVGQGVEALPKQVRNVVNMMKNVKLNLQSRTAAAAA